MGKIVETAPADILVLVGGRFIARTSNVELSKAIVLGSVQQRLEWAFCNRKKDGKKITVDVYIVPDEEVADNSEETSKVKIKILAKKEIRGLVESCEKQLREYLQQEEWLESVQFDYQQERMFKSMCLKV